MFDPNSLGTTPEDEAAVKAQAAKVKAVLAALASKLNPYGMLDKMAGIPENVPLGPDLKPIQPPAQPNLQGAAIPFPQKDIGPEEAFYRPQGDHSHYYEPPEEDEDNDESPKKKGR